MNKQTHVKLRRELNKKMKQANALLTDMRTNGYGDLSVIERSLKQFQKITNNQKDIFAAGRLSAIEKRMAIKSVDKFINSKWVTERGRQEILDKRINAFTQLNGTHQYGLTREETLKLFDVFSSDEYHKLIEKRYLDSEQIIDIVRNTNKDSNDIIQAMKNALKSKKSETQARIEIEKRL